MRRDHPRQHTSPPSITPPAAARERSVAVAGFHFNPPLRRGRVVRRPGQRLKSAICSPRCAWATTVAYDLATAPGLLTSTMLAAPYGDRVLRIFGEGVAECADRLPKRSGFRLGLSELLHLHQPSQSGNESDYQQ